MPCARFALALLAAPLTSNASGVLPGLLAIDHAEFAAASKSPQMTPATVALTTERLNSQRFISRDSDHSDNVTMPLFCVAAIVMLAILGFTRQSFSSAVEKVENEASAAPASSDAPHQPGWGTVGLCFCCCSLAAGIIPGQTIFVRLFAKAGAFKSLCSGGFDGPVCDAQFFRMAELLNTVSLAVMVPCVAFGIAFDRWGARTCGMLGSVWVAIAFGAIAVIVSLISAFPEANMELSYTLVVAILFADLGGFLCDYACLGYLWHFSAHQTVIFALWNVTYNSGAFFALGLELVMDWCGVPFVYPLVWWAIVQGAVTFILYRIVPSHSEFHAKAKEVLGVKLPEPPVSFELLPSLSAAWRVLLQDACKHFFMGVLMMSGTCYGMFYLSMAVPIGQTLFGFEEAGARLGNYCTISVGLVGCIAGLLIGIFADAYGFVVLIVTYTTSMLLFTSTFWISSWGAAAVACGSNAAFSMLVWVMTSRWFLKFAAPARLGTVMGIFYFLSYTASIVETWVMLEWSESMEPGRRRYLLPLGVSGAVAVFAACAFSLLFWLQPAFPETPRLVAEDEKDLTEPWGCSSFEEVGRLLGIEDRTELIRRLCSTDPSEIAALCAMLGNHERVSEPGRD